MLQALAEKGEHLLQDAGSCEILHAVQPCKHSQPMAVRPSVIIIQQVQTQILQYICILWAEIRNEYKDYFFFPLELFFLPFYSNVIGGRGTGLMNFDLFSHKDLYLWFRANIDQSNGSQNPAHFIKVNHTLMAAQVQNKF